MDVINKYFPGLTNRQKDQFLALAPLYFDWNEKINVISRKDIPEIYERHVLHSLAIAKIISFTGGTKILDVGTGGGFPGIPLAILFPEVQFHLVDSVGKKIKVVNAVATALELPNVAGQQIRAEELNGQYDFIVSRAVAAFPEFVSWVKNRVSDVQKNALANGILYLKGGDFSGEIKPFQNKITIYELPLYFEEEFFITKKLIHLKIER